jgi:hypothetical protein
MGKRMAKKARTNADKVANINKTEKVKTILVEFLENMVDAVETIALAFVSRKEAYRILYGGRDYSYAKYGRKVSELVRNGYLESSTDNSDSIRFTNKAKLKIIEKMVPSSDGVFRFISFDIPEHMSANRDGFRRTIKRLGFRQVQKSLWVIDRDVSGLVELAAGEYEVGEYIIYIVSGGSDVDKYISSSLKSKL